jgi:hypothetical protein
MTLEINFRVLETKSEEGFHSSSGKRCGLKIQSKSLVAMSL